MSDHVIEIDASRYEAEVLKSAVPVVLEFLVDPSPSVRAESRGARFVELWSDTRFADAHRLYERLGYRKSGVTRELHDMSGSVEYHFRKELGPAEGR